MKREGRPHGMVRTFTILPSPLNPRPAARVLNRLDSAPVAGIFTKVSARPTNHSKFTGKCERVRCSDCHIHPVGKSKDKSKGTQKSRASEANLNYKQVAWRVMSDRDFGLTRKLPVGSGYSASKILDELADDEDHDQFDFDDDHEDGCDVDGRDVDDDDVVCHPVVDVHGVIHDDDDDDDQDVVDDERVVMNFVDVGVVWDPVEDDDGWSLVVAGR